jgi:hypothetical protein
MQPSTLDILSGSVRASNVLGAVLIDLKDRPDARVATKTSNG